MADHKDATVPEGLDRIFGNLTADFAPAWVSGTSYAVGDRVIYGSQLWKCTAATDSEAPAEGSAYWAACDVGTELDTLSGEVSNLSGEIDALNGEVSGRNLLDNGWFTVNQRGATSYTSGYTVDRWKLLNNTSTATVSSNGINLKTADSSGADYFAQNLSSDVLNVINNNECTLSVIIYNPTTATSKVYSHTSSTGALSITPDSDSGKLLIYKNAEDSTISVRFGYDTQIIRAIKLELGSVSTLVNDSAPNYGEELLKCMSSTADSTDMHANRPYNKVLPINGDITTSNIVSDLNNFYSGVCLVSADNVANTPGSLSTYAPWYLVVSAGGVGTTTQVAISLWNDFAPKIRKCAAGSWFAWEELCPPTKMAKIASGSYTGTGESGPSNPNSLSFDFTPKMVVIGTNGYFISMILTNPANHAAVSTENSLYTVNVTWSGNTVHWNSQYDSEENIQFNEEGVTYYYTVIG